MPDAPTPLDLDAIRERATQGYPFLGLWAACNDALVLIAENERLRAENERLRTICAGPPRHITAEDLEGLATSMLTARPAPAWDEEAVVAESERRWPSSPPAGDEDMYPRSAIRATARGAFVTGAAWQRDHQPVKPSREDMVEAMLGSDIITDDLRAEASAQGSTQREPFLCFADAILDLRPGRSEVDDAL